MKYFSGVGCRGISGVIFKTLEKKRLGTTTRSSCDGITEQRIGTVCGDDAYFWASVEKYESKMQEKKACYVKMWETAGYKA